MPLKYALVHEWLTPKATGGSELVVREILNHIDADLYALIDFESINPESYLYKRQMARRFFNTFRMLVTVYKSTCHCGLWQLNKWICDTMT
ncbi:hypothetical protein VF03_04710 [Nostoc linckia z2]|nr:hypothetical protein VF03_04710 [Nostoc linckia z2]